MERQFKALKDGLRRQRKQAALAEWKAAADRRHLEIARRCRDYESSTDSSSSNESHLKKRGLLDLVKRSRNVDYLYDSDESSSEDGLSRALRASLKESSSQIDGTMEAAPLRLHSQGPRRSVDGHSKPSTDDLMKGLTEMSLNDDLMSGDLTDKVGDGKKSATKSRHVGSRCFV